MHEHTSVLDVEVTLICHEKRARLSLREMAPFFSKKNLNLANPRWRMNTKWFNNISICRTGDWKCLLKIKYKYTCSKPRAEDARQARLVMEADGPANTKTRERTESAAIAVQAMHADSFSANRVDPDSICSTSFGVKVEIPLSLAGMMWWSRTALRSPGRVSRLWRCAHQQPAPGGLLPTEKTSTVTSTTFGHFTLRFCQTDKTIVRTLILSASYDSSFWRKLLAAPSCRKVIETRSGQKRMFDPAGSKVCLRTYPCLEMWRALLCGESMR